jgi:glycosyltransferase involved in cell wall biosynthesis
MATEKFIEATSRDLNWRIRSVGKPSASRSSGQIGRLLSNSKAGAVAMFENRTLIPSAYMPINAGVTMMYNLGFAMVCAARGIPLLVHHHSYKYLNAPSSMMSWLNRFLSEKDGQIFLSETMQQAFDRRYHRRSQAIVLPNSFAMDVPSKSRTRGAVTNETYRVGHLSNLTIEKGLATVLSVFRKLLLVHENSELHLAGPAHGQEEKKLIADAQQTLGSRLIVHGPLYDAAKQTFFEKLDVFWFPSQYVNEAQPIVVVEAMAHGVPTVAMRRGCIQWLVGDTGIVASDEANFENQAIGFAREAKQPGSLPAYRAKCYERYQQLRTIEATGMRQAIAFLTRRL